MPPRRTIGLPEGLAIAYLALAGGVVYFSHFVVEILTALTFSFGLILRTTARYFVVTSHFDDHATFTTIAATVFLFGGVLWYWALGWTLRRVYCALRIWLHPIPTRDERA